MKKLFLFLLAGFPLVLAAQTEPSGKDTLLRFTSFGLADTGGEYLLAAGEKRTSLFTIPNNGFSVPVSAPKGDGPLMVGKENGDAFQGLASVNIPETGDRFLVLLFPEEKDTMRAVVIRADDPTFLPGHIMFFNQAKEPITADLGGVNLSLSSDSQTIFRPTQNDDQSNYQVRFYHDKEGKPKLFAASLWPYFDEKRVFVLFYTDATSGNATYRSIDEFTSWIKPSSK